VPNARAIDTITFAIRGVLIDFDSMLEPRAVAFRPLVTNRRATVPTVVGGAAL
jgi:hypothetical protein